MLREVEENGEGKTEKYNVAEKLFTRALIPGPDRWKSAFKTTDIKDEYEVNA